MRCQKACRDGEPVGGPALTCTSSSICLREIPQVLISEKTVVPAVCGPLIHLLRQLLFKFWHRHGAAVKITLNQIAADLF